MTSQTVDTLNDVTKMLIDSRMGYEKAAEVTDDTFAFRSEFARRAQERATLISEFQSRVSSLGGQPATEGGTLGSLHRAVTDFSSMFRDNTKAALDAIDDGEEKLAEEVESKLKQSDIDPEAHSLLKRAHAAAREGESFADRMEDRLQ